MSKIDSAAATGLPEDQSKTDNAIVDRLNAQNQRVSRLFAEWLSKRSQIANPGHGLLADDYCAVLRSIDNFAREISAAPTTLSYTVAQKIEVLEHCLGNQEGGAFDDRRELVLLASIKADILRMEASQ